MLHTSLIKQMQMYCRCRKREKACTAVTLCERWKLVWFAWPKQTVKKKQEDCGKKYPVNCTKQNSCAKIIVAIQSSEARALSLSPSDVGGQFGVIGSLAEVRRSPNIIKRNLPSHIRGQTPFTTAFSKKMNY